MIAAAIEAFTALEVIATDLPAVEAGLVALRAGRRFCRRRHCAPGRSSGRNRIRKLRSPRRRPAARQRCSCRRPVGIGLVRFPVKWTTHYMDEAHVLRDLVAIVDHGRIVTQGSSDELIRSIGAPSPSPRSGRARASCRAGSSVRRGGARSPDQACPPNPDRRCATRRGRPATSRAAMRNRRTTSLTGDDANLGT